MGRPVLAALLLFAGACSTGVVDELGPANDEVIDPAGGPRLPRAGSGAFLDDEGAPGAPATRAENVGPLFRAAYDGTPATSLNTFSRYEAALRSDGTLAIATKMGVPGSDPQPADYHGGSFYNGGTFRYAAVVSPVWEAKSVFDRVTPSFEALTPAGTWIEVHVWARVVTTGEWTKEYSLGVWAHDGSTVRRHSVSGQKDASGDVLTDTLELTSPADALQVSVTLFSADATTTPELRAVSAITALSGASPKPVADDPSVWGKTLAVPKHSQMTHPGGETWGSPASTSMLLAWWGVTSSPPEAAAMSTDVVHGGTGNRVFDTAFAAAAADGELHSMVTRLSSFGQIEPLVAGGIPVAIGVAYGAGELDGAPVESTAAHMLVVKGFSPAGAVLVNDPAFASEGAVETTYDRAQLTAAWRRAGGTTYLVWPKGKKLPADPLGGY